jgi:hypothetical protein
MALEKPQYENILVLLDNTKVLYMKHHFFPTPKAYTFLMVSAIRADV